MPNVVHLQVIPPAPRSVDWRFVVRYSKQCTCHQPLHRAFTNGDQPKIFLGTDYVPMLIAHFYLPSQSFNYQPSDSRESSYVNVLGDAWHRKLVCVAVTVTGGTYKYMRAALYGQQRWLVALPRVPIITAHFFTILHTR